ncbi:hypothetical protein BDP55DRAFT_166325 [Colletotrichum godetiae]|uniref:Uncharacterized protein n=1 Tax=Colletotrichum godetiae TaxID=1209918 RepID=A0AAJ0ETG2_9PEZI|nr:uncharacterized protein BDP55DRAFT_166325 [Colletotrichum godetiae]KAK1675007.1 hypothetical protein BDP55DRAFT_166325 [Colletotrichum godetiae]
MFESSRLLCSRHVASSTALVRFSIVGNPGYVRSAWWDLSTDRHGAYDPQIRTSAPIRVLLPLALCPMITSPRFGICWHSLKTFRARSISNPFRNPSAPLAITRGTSSGVLRLFSTPWFMEFLHTPPTRTQRSLAHHTIWSTPAAGSLSRKKTAKKELRETKRPRRVTSGKSPGANTRSGSWPSWSEWIQSRNLYHFPTARGRVPETKVFVSRD